MRYIYDMIGYKMMCFKVQVAVTVNLRNVRVNTGTKYLVLISFGVEKIVLFIRVNK